MQKEPIASDTVLTVPERLMIFFSLVAIGFALYDRIYWAERGFLQNDTSMLGCCTSSILAIIFWIWAGAITHREQDSWQSEADNQAAPKEIKPKKKSKTPKDSKKRNKAKRSSKIPSKECEHCGFLNNANNNPNWAMMENPDILTASLVDPEKADELADLLKGTMGGDILCAKCGYNFWVSADELAGKETGSGVQVDSFSPGVQESIRKRLTNKINEISAEEKLSKARDTRDVASLIEALDDSWSVRKDAAEELGKIGDESAVDPLIKMIEETHVVVLKATVGVGSSEIAADPAEAVNTAITALGKIGNVRAVESLIKLLEDSKETKWQSGIGFEADKWELQGSKAETFEELFEQIGHFERVAYAEGIRRDSAEALGEIGDLRAVKPLIKALEDENKYVRSHAVWALGEIGDARAVESLVELLEDDARLLPGEDSVQSHAAQALGLIGDARAVEPLIKALGPEPLDDQNGYFRFQCSVALTRFGSAAVVPLIKALGNQSEAIYESAVEALGHIGAIAVDPLIEALDANNPIPEQSVMMVGLTRDKKLDVRRGAAKALVIIGDKRAAPSLEKAGFWVQSMWILKDVSGFINALEDDNTQVRRFSAGALYKIGDARAVEPLKKALDDEDNEVRKVAKEALRRLGHEVND